MAWRGVGMCFAPATAPWVAGRLRGGCPVHLLEGDREAAAQQVGGEMGALVAQADEAAARGGLVFSLVSSTL